MGYEPIYLIRS
jgi:hypothetical protein